MRPAPWLHLEPHRLGGLYASPYGSPYGAFEVLHKPTATTLRIIASSDVFEHVSVSTARRTPNWAEMEFACRLFWDEEEAVMQLHPPRSQWVSNHPYVLHLWKPADPATPIPLPPQLMVGIPGVEFDPNNPRDRDAAAAVHAALSQKLDAHLRSGGR
jgi:hypothetical protein